MYVDPTPKPEDKNLLEQAYKKHIYILFLRKPLVTEKLKIYGGGYIDLHMN